MRNNADFLLLIAQRLGRLQHSRQALICGLDTEALHDFRVDLRSLRTLLPLVLSNYKQVDKAILQAWRSLAKLSNTPRDAEVMMALAGSKMSDEQWHLLQQNYTMGLNQLQTLLASERIKTLITNTLQQVRHRLSKIKQQDLKRCIQQHYSHLYQSLLAAHSKSTPKLPEWHQRRIKIKQLRYLIELASDWLVLADTDVLSKLKITQTSLGNLQDQYVLAQWLKHTTIKKRYFKIALSDWNKLIRQLKITAAP